MLPPIFPATNPIFANDKLHSKESIDFIANPQLFELYLNNIKQYKLGIVKVNVNKEQLKKLINSLINQAKIKVEQFEQLQNNMNGCKLLLLPEDQFNQRKGEKFLGNYIYIKKEPLTESKVIYINIDGEQEAIPIFDIENFEVIRKRIMGDKHEISLSNKDIFDLITSQSHHNHIPSTVPVRVLILSNNHLTDDDATHLAEFFQQSHHLIYVDLSNNNFTTLGEGRLKASLSSTAEHTPRIRLMQDLKFGLYKLIYWKVGNGQNNNSSRGRRILKRRSDHVALEVLTPSCEYFYVSYWPGGALSTKFYDKHKYGKYKPKLMTLDTLDLDSRKMTTYFINNILDNEHTQYSICAECINIFSCKNEIVLFNCSTLVMKLLSEGGIEKHFPSRAQFGNLRYLILLSASRVFSVVFLLGCALYPILDDYVGDEHWKAITGTIILILSNGACIAYLERQRNLVEIDLYDFFVGINASAGFSMAALFHRWLQRSHNMPDYMSAPILIILPFIGLYICGKLASFIVSMRTCHNYYGTPYTISPVNILKWLEHIKATQHISDKTKLFIFIKELFPITIFYINWFSCYLFRQIDKIPILAPLIEGAFNIDLDYWFSSGILAFYFGLPLGTLISYQLTKKVVGHVAKKIQEEKIELSEQQFIDNYEQQGLSRFFLTTITTLYGIMLIISACHYFSLDNPLLEGLLSALGGILGFLIGKILTPHKQTTFYQDNSFHGRHNFVRQFNQDQDEKITNNERTLLLEENLDVDEKNLIPDRNNQQQFSFHPI